MKDSDYLRIAILDNDILALQMLCHLVNHLASDFKVIWYSKSATEALHKCFVENLAPDVLVLDMALDDIPGPQVCHFIRQKTSQIGLIGVTAYPVKLYTQDLIDGGAQALISKEKIGILGESAIRRAASGLAQNDNGPFLSTSDAHRLISESRRLFFPLTQREKEILSYFSRGFTTDEIEKELEISRNTIFTHTHRAIKKLHAKNRAEALLICTKYNLLNIDPRV